MNFSKNFLLLLSAVFLCFVAIHCSEIPPAAGENNELVVNNARNDDHNGPFPADFFGPYKLIRPLREPYLNLYMKYDLMMIWGSLSYFLSKRSNDYRINRYVTVGLASYFAIFHLPSLFGLHWVASINRQARTLSSFDGVFFWGLLSLWISRILNQPRIHHYTSLGLASYISVNHLPEIFGLNFVASFEHSEGRISPASESTGEIFLAEGTVPYHRDVCFQIFRNIQLELSEMFLTLFGLRK